MASLKIKSCAWLLIPLLGVGVASQVHAVSQSEVDKLSKKCESLRQKELEPIRAQKTQTCIEQQLRSKGHCERYYTTYGNVGASSMGPTAGMFYDLPECQSWIQAKEQLRMSHSRVER